MCCSVISHKSPHGTSAISKGSLMIFTTCMLQPCAGCSDTIICFRKYSSRKCSELNVAVIVCAPLVVELLKFLLCIECASTTMCIWCTVPEIGAQDGECGFPQEILVALLVTCGENVFKLVVSGGSGVVASLSFRSQAHMEC